MSSTNANTKPLVVAARFLLIANVLIFVGAWFAMPAYHKMNPHPNAFAERVGFELLTAIDVLGAVLLIKGWIRVGVALFAVTSSIWCGYSIFLQLQADKELAWLWAPLIAYWDVVLLAFLIWRQQVRG